MDGEGAGRVGTGASEARDDGEQVPSAAEVLGRVRASGRDRAAGSSLAAPTTSPATDVRFEVALGLLNDATGYYIARLREETDKPVLRLPREESRGSEVDAIREQLAMIAEVREWLFPDDAAAVEAVIAHYGALVRRRVCGHRRLEQAREAGEL